MLFLILIRLNSVSVCMRCDAQSVGSCVRCFFALMTCCKHGGMTSILLSSVQAQLFCCGL